MLGCCVASMGVALVPAAVLDTYTERARISGHKLGGNPTSLRTLYIARQDSLQPKVAALGRLLAEHQ